VSAPIVRHSFGVLARALRTTTERLAREVHTPGDEPPCWTALEWRVARAAAALQGTSTLLANRLRWRGPHDWQAFLAQQRAQSLLRETTIDETLARLDDSLRAAGVGAIALKGAALRRLPIYLPGERPMGDIDLLVGDADAERIEAALDIAGYRHSHSSRRHVVFEPVATTAGSDFGEHVGNALKIEVHLRIAEPLPSNFVDITASLLPHRPDPGLHAYPDDAALLEHLLLHAAGNMRAHALRQVQLHDIAMLAGRLEPGEWQSLLNPQRPGGRWWLYPALAITANYYPGCIPLAELAAARAACRLWLRRAQHGITLTEVSWSNLRIAAFPGIAWSGSPFEALRFVRSRVFPDRLALEGLEDIRRRVPALDRIPWYGESHRKRIARWVFSRPPRVQTMNSVMTAVADEDAGSSGSELQQRMS
jgi:hypothetical protein